MFSRKTPAKPRWAASDGDVLPQPERDQIKVNRAQVAKVRRVRGATRSLPRR